MMTYEEALKEIPTIDDFCHQVCNSCNEEWYCPSYCDDLMKARSMDFVRIVKKYAENNGMISWAMQYVKRAVVKTKSERIKNFKPINKENFREARCPKCFSRVYYPIETCENCGQVIDWE